MDSFLCDMNSKLKRTESLQSLRTSFLSSKNLDRNQSLCSEKCYNKPQNSFLNNQFHSQSQVQCSVVPNNRTASKLNDQSLTYVPDNSFLDRSQTLSLFHTQNRHLPLCRRFINKDQSLSCGQTIRMDEVQYPSHSNQLPEKSDISYRLGYNFNNRMHNNGVSNQNNIDDRHFKRPYEVGDESDTMGKLGQLKNTNQFRVPNVQCNITGTTYTNNQTQSDMSILSSLFPAPTYSLKKIKGELLTAVSVIDLLNLQIGIPIDEMEIEINIITFLMKLKRKVQKLLIKHQSLVSMKMTTDQAQHIQQWLSSGNMGQCEQIGTSIFQNKPYTQSSMDIYNRIQQSANMSRMEREISHTFQGNNGFDHNPLTSILSDDEEVDMSSFNNSEKARLRDQSLMEVPQVSFISKVNNIGILQNKLTENNYKNIANGKHIKRALMMCPPAENVGQNIAESSLINNSYRVSSRGRLIIPKTNYWEVVKEDKRNNTTINLKNVGVVTRHRRNAVSLSSSVRNASLKEVKQSKTKHRDDQFKKPATIQNRKQESKQKQSLTTSFLNQTKQTKTKTTKALNECSTSIAGSNQVSKSKTKTTSKVNIPVSLQKKGINKKQVLKKNNNKENLPGEANIVRNIPAKESGNPPAALRGRKRKSSLDASVAMKKKIQPDMHSNSLLNANTQCFKTQSPSVEIISETSSPKVVKNNINKVMAPLSEIRSTPSTRYSGSFINSNGKSQSAMNSDMHSVKSRATGLKTTSETNKQEKQIVTGDSVAERLPTLVHHRNGKTPVKQAIRTELTSAVRSSYNHFNSWFDESDDDSDESLEGLN